MVCTSCFVVNPLAFLLRVNVLFCFVCSSGRVLWVLPHEGVLLVTFRLGDRKVSSGMRCGHGFFSHLFHCLHHTSHYDPFPHTLRSHMVSNSCAFSSRRRISQSLIRYNIGIVVRYPQVDPLDLSQSKQYLNEYDIDLMQYGRHLIHSDIVSGLEIYFNVNSP